MGAGFKPALYIMLGVPDPFRYYLRVRFSECDAQKIVFNARYGEYVDLATTEFLRALGWGGAGAQNALDYRLVKQTLEWKSPAAFDQVLELSVGVARLGTTSFALETIFRIAGEAAVTTRAETVYVVVNAETFAKAPLPPQFRAALERGAPGAVTDHAGYLRLIPT